MLLLCYCRVSTDEQVAGYSLDAQQKMINDWVQIKYPDAQTTFYIEKGRSATDLNRPQLKELLERAKKEKAYAVVVLCLDRLTRDIEDLCWLMNFFQDTGIKLLSVMNYVDLDSADGRGNLLYNGVSAMMESQKISERTIRGMKQAVVEGKYPFAKSPLGYKKIDDKLVLSDDKNEIEAIRYIFNTIADNKIHFTSIRAHIKNEFNLDINTAAIYKILNRQLYTGKMKYRGIENKNYCEPIISDDVYKKAVQNYRKRRRSGRKAEYYFKNVVCCSNCDDVLMNQSCGYGGHNKEVYSYYVCPECKRIVSQIKLVEMLAPDLQNLAYKYINEKDGVTDIQKTIEDLKNQQAMLIEKQKGDQAISIDAFYDLFRDLEAKIEELNQTKYQVNTKVKPYSHLNFQTKKEITKKYIDRVQIFFKDKKYEAVIKEK